MRNRGKVSRRGEIGTRTHKGKRYKRTFPVPGELGTTMEEFPSSLMCPCSFADIYGVLAKYCYLINGVICEGTSSFLFSYLLNRSQFPSGPVETWSARQHEGEVLITCIFGDEYLQVNPSVWTWKIYSLVYPNVVCCQSGSSGKFLKGQRAWNQICEVKWHWRPQQILVEEICVLQFETGSGTELSPRFWTGVLEI